MHPLLDPFSGSRDEAADACLAYVRRRHRVAGRVARVWPGGVGRELGLVFAWFQTARELAREADEFVRRRGSELLRATVGDPNERDVVGALALALPSTLGAHGIAPTTFLASLEERDRGSSVGAFASRTELLGHASKLTRPEALAYAKILGLDGDRVRLQVQALGEGLQLVRWLVDALAELRAGRLRFAADDVARFRVSLSTLERGDDTPEIRALAAAQAEWAGGLLAKGWPVCRELGWVRGRALAALLRWNVAELAALEEREFRPGPPPPAGWFRLGACGAIALVTRREADW